MGLIWSINKVDACITRVRKDGSIGKLLDIHRKDRNINPGTREQVAGANKRRSVQPRVEICLEQHTFPEQASGSKGKQNGIKKRRKRPRTHEEATKGKK